MSPSASTRISIATPPPSVAAAPSPAPHPARPPFQGGAAGFIGYDWGETLEPTVAPPPYDDLALPDAVLGVYDWVIAWDHEQRRAWMISTGLPERDPAKRSRRAAARLEEV